ncbi:lipase 3-like [Hetaerina americana]|uniref:lipase 3-like n=1 Tax=Hetaerina americana TaxID=62018 RepID=UPI003A7F4053
MNILRDIFFMLLMFGQAEAKEDGAEIPTTEDLIAWHGYSVEKHEVTTSDNYVLTLFRITDTPNCRDLRKESVILAHGILCTSTDWVITGPENALGYLLADNGYDVWLMNFRGNRYARKNVDFTPEEEGFWNFSWNEMGKYDLPAEIDYVISQTGEPHMFYIGHSMGTTMFYVMGSLRPEYNAKIRAHFSLAPVGFMDGVRSPMRLLAPFVTEIKWISKFMGINEFFPSTDLYGFLGNALCEDEAITQSLCSDIIFLICGFDSKELNETMIPVIMGHTPAGASTKQVLHYAQEINSGKFRQYDYGLKNFFVYHRFTPPDYDLSLVTAPVYLYYSGNDWLSGKDNVIQLYEQLGNAKGRFLVTDKDFNHLDYLWAIDAKELVYDKIMSLMKRH